ncbi:MAG: PIG-L family deacetylase [Planctomycetota bacterium]|nr:MAG: PIG-L family deacetylase [Planctomycetota bacterium]
MRFTRPEADFFVPDQAPPEQALARATHLGIGAHQDDLEFMAFSAIEECCGRDDLWFAGVTVTDGGGSARSGPYASFSDEEMKAVRRREQRKAAVVGDYACQIQLAWPSAAVKDAAVTAVVDDLERILRAARPRTVFLHNPADKHDTHVACCLRGIAALRRLAPEERPARVYGCEVWRSLDWLLDSDKVVLPVDRRPNLAAALAGVFDSQLSGGKRYDLAIHGRWRANATLFESHEVDRSTGLAWAMDLSPLLREPAPAVAELVLEHLERLRRDVVERLRRLGG